MPNESSPAPDRAGPGLLAGLVELMGARFDAGRNADAVAVADVLLQLDPDNREALLHKGGALMRMKEVGYRAEARLTLEHLLEVDPAQHEAAVGLVRMYLAIGPLERARVLLPRLMALRPDDARLASFRHELDARLASTIEVGSLAAGSPAPAVRRQVSRARYPDALSAFADAREAARRYLLPPGPPPERFLTPAARGFTLGSCFAGRIARELQRLGRDVFHMQLAETVNTTFANLAFLRWLATGTGRHAAYFEREALERKAPRAEIAARLAAADFVIYTLGVAPAFFERASGEFVPHQAEDFRQFRFLADHEYRTSTVAQNAANLRAIHAELQRVRPGMRLVLTVSPVPLAATFEMPSAVVADCISKSVLRAAAHEFMGDAGPGVSYWPSYEMVRWIGGHTGGAFGGDDGSNHHVTDALVTDIVELFVEHFGAPPAA